MKRLATVTLALVALMTFSAAAQQPLEYKVTVVGETAIGAPGDHFLTFSGPVQIPEITLPAGRYVFTIVAPSIIQVRSVDRTQYYAMFHTVPVQRIEAGDQYQIAAVKTGDASPLRIAKWFLPNQALGFEFIYPQAELTGER